MQVTVAILLNSFVGAINAAEEEEAAAVAQGMKSKEMLRYFCLVCPRDKFRSSKPPP
jgi:hypothetical protein